MKLAGCGPCGRCTYRAGCRPRLYPKLLADKNEYVRAWAVQLSLDRDQPQLAELLPEFAAMAAGDHRQ